MKKFLVLMAMVAALALMAIPAYAIEADREEITVNVVVNAWAEIAMDSEITLTINGPDGATDSLGGTVNSNTTWTMSTIIHSNNANLGLTAEVLPATGGPGAGIEITLTVVLDAYGFQDDQPLSEADGSAAVVTVDVIATIQHTVARAKLIQVE